MLNDQNSEKYLEFEEKIKILSDRINFLESESKNNWDLFLRAKADLENLRKRADKEIVNITKYSNKNLFLDLLPLLDSFDACLEKKEDISFNTFLLFHKLLLNLFEKYNVKKIDVKENSFLDPFKHEVVSIVNSDVYDNIICSILQSGYEIHDHILRYVKVSIYKKNEN